MAEDGRAEHDERVASGPGELGGRIRRPGFVQRDDPLGLDAGIPSTGQELRHLAATYASFEQADPARLEEGQVNADREAAIREAYPAIANGDAVPKDVFDAKVAEWIALYDGVKAALAAARERNETLAGVIEKRQRAYDEQNRQLREALLDASLALRDIAESSPNWMEEDAVAKHSRWCNEKARDAWQKAEAAALDATEART